MQKRYQQNNTILMATFHWNISPSELMKIYSVSMIMLPCLLMSKKIHRGNRDIVHRMGKVYKKQSNNASMMCIKLNIKIWSEKPKEKMHYQSHSTVGLPTACICHGIIKQLTSCVAQPKDCTTWCATARSREESPLSSKGQKNCPRQWIIHLL